VWPSVHILFAFGLRRTVMIMEAAPPLDSVGTSANVEQDKDTDTKWMDEVRAWRPPCTLLAISSRSALSGEVVTVADMRPDDHVRDLEHAIAKSVGSSGRIRILLEGKQLDSTSSLKDAGLSDGVEVLHVACAASILATGSSDCTARIWNSETGQCTATLMGHAGRITAVVFLPDAMRIKTTSADCSEKTWNMGTGECESTIRSLPFTSSTSLSPDGSRAVTGSLERIARIWNRGTGECERKLWGHRGTVSCACFCPDGKLVATGATDNVAKIWDAETGECLHTLRGHAGFVTSVSFSSDSASLASASNDGTAKVWIVATGQCHVTLEGHEGAVNSVAFAP